MAMILARYVTTFSPRERAIIGPLLQWLPADHHAAFRVFVACACLALIAPIMSPERFGAGACRVTRDISKFQLAGRASLTVSGSVPFCQMSVRIPTVLIHALTITTEPTHGTAKPLGHGAILYEPDPDYRGRDYFVIELRGESASRKGTSLIRVDVTSK